MALLNEPIKLLPSPFQFSRSYKLNFLDRCFQRKYTSKRMDIRELLEKTDKKLFKVSSVDPDCPLSNIIQQRCFALAVSSSLILSFVCLQYSVVFIYFRQWMCLMLFLVYWFLLLAATQAYRCYYSLRAISPIWASEASLARTRKRAAKPFLCPSLARSREAHFASPNRRACWQAIVTTFQVLLLLFTSLCCCWLFSLGVLGLQLLRLGGFEVWGVLRFGS